MRNRARKCYIFLCTIIFEVTWPFWKMCCPLNFIWVAIHNSQSKKSKFSFCPMNWTSLISKICKNNNLIVSCNSTFHCDTALVAATVRQKKRRKRGIWVKWSHLEASCHKSCSKMQFLLLWWLSGLLIVFSFDKVWRTTMRLLTGGTVQEYGGSRMMMIVSRG